MIKCSFLIFAFVCVVENVAEPDDTLKNISEIIRTLRNIKTPSSHSPSFKKHKRDDVRLRATTDELIDYYGYKGENHRVETADGYILTLHRITGKKASPNPNGKPVVYLQHGLLGCSIDWVIAGHNRSLAFMLVDLGFDVWLGNSRGNTYSRMHSSISPEEKEFWNFSWHELGIYDLPSSIDYILSTTRKDKLIFVGYSQGTTTSYVLLSERPEYNDKISKLISLAPVAFGCSDNRLMQSLSLSIEAEERLLAYLGIHELIQFNEIMKTFLFYVCKKNSTTALLCESLFFLVGGVSEELYDEDLYPVILQHLPAGSSVKQVIHYGQMVKTGLFRMFAYAPPLNRKMYGNLNPPDYEIENIKVPTTLFTGRHDTLAAITDAKKLYNKLPNPNGFIVVPHPTFNHFDFLWAKGIKHLLYERVISVITNGYY